MSITDLTVTAAGTTSVESFRPWHLSSHRSNFLWLSDLHHHLRRNDHLPTDPAAPPVEYQNRPESRCGVSVLAGTIYHRVLHFAIDPDSPGGLWRWKFHHARVVGHH